MRERLARVAGQVSTVAAAREGAVSDHTAVALEAVMAVLQADYGTIAAFSAGPSALPQDDRLASMGHVFGLDEVARDLLAVGVAPELDANFGSVFDLLTGRTGVGRPTVGLALELCGVPSAHADVAKLLGSSGPLLRNRLLEVVGDASWLIRSVRVPDRVRAHLCGNEAADVEVAAVSVDTVPFECPAASQIARVVASGEPLVWVHSKVGTAGIATAVAGLAEAGLGALVVDVRMAPAATNQADLLTACAREAGMHGAATLNG